MEKAKEKFEKEKKERKAALERHYTSLPKEPSVLIYPSKTAKGGKFDCKCSSLSTLLDYRLDDNKEASFEVFLFAEALREAIDRSSAFLVYHAIDAALPRDSERKRRDEVLNSETTLVVAIEPVVEGESEADSNGDVQMETDANGTETMETDKPASEKEEDIIIVGEKKAPVADPRTKYKAFVNDVQMFSAFAHFDENVCGHIDDRDMEEILYTIGIDLSRGDVQRIIKKLSARDRINYRNLTDRWVDKDDNVKYVPTAAPEAKSLSELAAGHTLSEEAGKERSQEPALGSTPDVTDTGVVFYKGSVLNIAQSMELNKEVETERSSALLKVEQLELQLKTTKEQREYLEKKKKRLEDDLDRYKKKLYDSEKSLKNSQDDTVLMKTSLQDCKRYSDRISNTVERLFPPPKKEEKSSKKDDTPKDKENSGEQQSEDTQQKPETAATTEIEVYEIPDDEEEPEGGEQPAGHQEVFSNGEVTTEAAGRNSADKSEQLTN